MQGLLYDIRFNMHILLYDAHLTCRIYQKIHATKKYTQTCCDYDFVCVFWYIKLNKYDTIGLV